MKKRKAQIAIALSAAMALTTAVPGVAASYKVSSPVAVTKESAEKQKAAPAVQTADSKAADGRNELTVYDKAGNVKEFVFYVDQTAPNVTVDVEKPDQPTPTKTVTITGDEPFKVNNSATSKLGFSAQNDDDGDGYATVWKASAGHPAYEGVEVEDQLGNRTSVAVFVTNVDSTVPTATINYSITVPTSGDVTAQMIWNTYPSEDVEDRLLADGWKKTGEIPATFVKTYRENTHVEYNNIKSYTGVPGKDVVFDITNIDKTGPEVTVEVENPDQMTYTKNVKLTGNEPFKVYVTDESNLRFTAWNDDDGDGYATIWQASTQKPVDESYTVEDLLGNKSSVGVLVTNVDSTVPEATVNYTVTNPTPNGVPVQIVWNTQLSSETDQMLQADGWKKPVEDQPTYVRIFRDNETLTYTNIKSHTGIPGRTLVVTVSNITEEVKLNIYDEENAVQVKEEKMTVDKDAVHVSTSSLTVPEGYELVSTGDLPITSDGYVYVGIRPVEGTAEAKLVIHFVGAFGEEMDVEPVTVTKTGEEGQWISFEYGKDWELPEGYEFAEEFDENTAKQSFMVKCGETLEIPEIGIVPVK